MNLPAYRSVLELSDNDIEDILRVVYPDLNEDTPGAARLARIERDNESVRISVESSYELDEFDDIENEQDEFGWAEDTFVLSDFDGLESYDMEVDDELLQKKLLSIGCHPLLRDNPFLR